MSTTVPFATSTEFLASIRARHADAEAMTAVADFETPEQVADAILQPEWLYTHRAPKWSTYYGGPAQEIQAQFFDHFLRGDLTGMPNVRPVRIEVRESLRTVAAVHTATHWPPEQVQPLTLHATDRELHHRRPSEQASIAPPRAGAQFRWQFQTQTDVVGPMRLRVPVSVERNDLTLFAGIRKMHDGREVVFEGSYGFTEDIVTRGWRNLLFTALKLFTPAKKAFESPAKNMTLDEYDEPSVV